ncbi:glyoxylate reductase [Ancylobacter aquaticus]|uniref:Glyoxylate reductase n=1 Tax=Ancylobacter aquaticus TaxID=100 RepID=A0A4R1HZR0_ANCAQ|nr:D-glycerate dehydrogenase [Ancylobacter aquaticus]TCK28337.1 glyoxylate reductase [Ancylobacter aquaticus]
MRGDTVILTSRLPEALVDEIRKVATVVLGDHPAKAMRRDEVLAHLRDATAIINQNELKIDAALLDAAPHLRLVANAAAGFDNMDVAAMRERAVIGTNCPDAYSADTATHTVGLLLALTRRLIEADAYVRSGRWQAEGWMPGGRWDGVSLAGKRYGVVGYGAIGRQVAQRVRAFGMDVSHHSPTDTGEEGWLPLDELLATSDVVGLHCPLNTSTRHLIDAQRLERMKQGAILINVARGPVVKNDDLVAALESGHLGGAGLDVFEFEPLVPEALFAMSNVVLSPHMAGCTVESRQSAWRLCVDNVLAVLDGRPAKTPAFMP